MCEDRNVSKLKKPGTKEKRVMHAWVKSQDFSHSSAICPLLSSYSPVSVRTIAHVSLGEQQYSMSDNCNRDLFPYSCQTSTPAIGKKGHPHSSFTSKIFSVKKINRCFTASEKYLHILQICILSVTKIHLITGNEQFQKNNV